VLSQTPPSPGRREKKFEVFIPSLQLGQVRQSDSDLPATSGRNVQYRLPFGVTKAKPAGIQISEAAYEWQKESFQFDASPAFETQRRKACLRTACPFC
jgi:hypothetical protein